MTPENQFPAARMLCCALLLSLALGGCSTFPAWLSSSGPSREQITDKQDSRAVEGIQVVKVDDALARRLTDSRRPGRFSDIFPNSGASNYEIGPGDIIEVSIWEAPPAILFGIAIDPKGGASTRVALPEQMVTPDGMIAIPFAGKVSVKGRTTEEIEADVGKRLKGKANQPQVLVRVVKNNTSSVTIVGEVTTSTQMALTPKGERLLDALAAGGGVKQPVTRVALQLSRDGVTATMPLDTIIRDPKQNVMLKPGDVVTALFQPQTFSVVGATGKNDEIPFEAQGISLAQALARSGGLNDNRADARGVFVFRFEDAKLVDGKAIPPRAGDGTVPVVYQIDLRDPGAFFMTQDFAIRDRDVIYVANSPDAEFEKFLRLVISVAVPSVSINSSLRQ